MSVTALDIARYLLHLNNEGIEPDLVSHLQLQKLLYYCQGWSLGMRDRPLFGDRIEAWIHGPVAPSVYRVFADYHEQPLPPSEGDNVATISDEDKRFIQPIWDHYRRFSANELRRKTHEEKPWRDARGLTPNDRRSDAEITHEALRTFFGEQRQLTAASLGLPTQMFSQREPLPLEALIAEFS